MDYTKDQYALMEKLSQKVDFASLSEEEQQTLIFLDQERIVQALAQIRDGLYTLSPHGKRMLAAYHKKQAEKEERTRKERQAKVEQALRDVQERKRQDSIRQEDIRREQEKERKRDRQAVDEKADRKAERRADRAFQVLLMFVSSILSFVVGMLVEHSRGIIDWIVSFF